MKKITVIGAYGLPSFLPPYSFMRDPDDALREHLIDNLDGENAHRGFAGIAQDWPSELRGTRPDDLPHSGWELVEHLRLAQRDILDFWQNPGYTAPDWPDGYWPDEREPPSDDAWDASLQQFDDDLATLKSLIRETADLHAEIPHGSGQTYLREALVVADHNAYHLGQLVTVRRLLGAWPPG
jgi:hypothetical protein